MNLPGRLWRERKAYLLEAFLIFNFAALAGDILIAHQVNDFEHKAEWVPFVYSVLAAFVLAPVFGRTWIKQDMRCARWLVILIGLGSFAVGAAGFYFHIKSQFLREQSIKHLVYTAPFVAPLAYCGIGSLLIFNRLYAKDAGWAHGVAFGALGGYFGNFVLTLCDHAQNGFFHPAEWVAVGASALATGFVTAAIIRGAESKAFLHWLLGVLGMQFLVGVSGFLYHNYANWRGDVQNVIDRFVHGAPMLAPMLLINISILAAFAWTDWWLTAQSKMRSKFAE